MTTGKTIALSRLEEAQAGIKIVGRNVSNLRYADNTTLMAESEEELNSLLMRMKCWDPLMNRDLVVWRQR